MPIYTTLDQALAAMNSGVMQGLISPLPLTDVTPVEDYSTGLAPVQQAQYQAYESIVNQFGQYNQGSGSEGAHYFELNPFVSEGIMCANCVFYGQGACEIVAGSIQPQAVCKFWIIPESLITQTQPNTELINQIQELLMSGQTNDQIQAELDVSVDLIIEAAAQAARNNN